MSVTEAVGPVDYLVIEFPDATTTGGPAAALADLVERGTIRLYDLVVLAKSPDGGVTTLVPPSAGDPPTPFGSFSGARSGLLGDEDLTAAGQLLEAGTTALVVVYENAWAAHFVAEARSVGGEVLASARVTAQELLDTLDALDTTDPVA